jgi:hypothetical protein
MSGGWSRYTRGASSGTGCFDALIAGLAFATLVGLIVHFLPDGDVDQNMRPRTDCNALAHLAAADGTIDHAEMHAINDCVEANENGGEGVPS